VNDVVPTIYEILDIIPPRIVNGVEQDTIDGVSFAYTLDDSKAKGQLFTQYFEIMGSRAIDHDGWLACAFGRCRSSVRSLGPCRWRGSRWLAESAGRNQYV
jgi:arylsulfatase A-like enzyme